MKLSPVNYNQNVYKIVITWSRPKRITYFFKKPDDKDASLYMVIHKKKKKILYIGMTLNLYAHNRIKEHGYKEEFISTGVLKVKRGKYTEQRVKDAESLLIYVCNPPDNTSKKGWIKLEETLLENRGFSSLLPRFLFHGTCSNRV